MPRRRTLELTQKQRQELVHCRDHHQLPYLREVEQGGDQTMDLVDFGIGGATGM